MPGARRRRSSSAADARPVRNRPSRSPNNEDADAPPAAQVPAAADAPRGRPSLPISYNRIVRAAKGPTFTYNDLALMAAHLRRQQTRTILARAAARHPDVAMALSAAVEFENKQCIGDPLDFERYTKTAWLALHSRYPKHIRRKFDLARAVDREFEYMSTDISAVVLEEGDCAITKLDALCTMCDLFLAICLSKGPLAREVRNLHRTGQPTWPRDIVRILGNPPRYLPYVANDEGFGDRFTEASIAAAKYGCFVDVLLTVGNIMYGKGTPGAVRPTDPYNLR